MNIGAIIIGDEILCGKRADRHFAQLIATLQSRGLQLSWVQYLPDVRTQITVALRAALHGSDSASGSVSSVVFCYGGIGVTPDDHTRQAAAAAFEQPLEIHQDAEREIRARMAEMSRPVTPERLELGAFPKGSRIIPNPINRIAGFSYQDLHFFPGFPAMATPMTAWVLDTYYSSQFGSGEFCEHSFLIWDGLESDLLQLMRSLQDKAPNITVFSLPSLGGNLGGNLSGNLAGKNGYKEDRPHLELGVRGIISHRSTVESATQEIAAELTRRKLVFEVLK